MVAFKVRNYALTLVTSTPTAYLTHTIHKYTKVKVPVPKINTTSAEQLGRATLPLPLAYKNPYHCWPTRVSCYTLTPD